MNVDLCDPVLTRTIHQIAWRTVRHLSSKEQVDVHADLVQELTLKALELGESYRGDQGATFSTYAYRPLSLHAFHALTRYELPVNAGKNNRAFWAMRRQLPSQLHDPRALEAPPQDHMDGLLAADTPVDEAAEESDLGAHLRRLAREHTAEDTAVIEAVVFDEQPYTDVAARSGRKIKSLRRVVAGYREQIRKDPELRALYASRR